ncbi:hypothetical protein DFR50_116103 [Roseiarcus fermentans]|uniref:Uncharacterized protein n=1 Tax=Roseiarcus fermentans TaxID=1473586 RepID=A0A366F9W9_9HYPH|nr:hypothetical protein [Roseiarcus fermentans]RBP11408.1 hypothetical protein DFR50_116103 [Roseiarcus fermentans]
MGWKTDTVLIRPAHVGADAQALLGSLGFSDLTPLGERPFEAAIWPKTGEVWIGGAGECLMISARGLCGEVFKPGAAPFVQALARRFPGGEIAAATLHSVVNLWGFAVLRDGVALRRKAGSADDGTFEDFGAPLPEERELLARSTLDGEGRRVYRLPDFAGEAMSEDQVGEEYVFRIFERLTGQRPDTGETLLDTPCAGFSFSSLAVAAPHRPWWKVWR